MSVGKTIPALVTFSVWRGLSPWTEFHIPKFQVLSSHCLETKQQFHQPGRRNNPNNFAEMKTCLSHSKGAEINAKPETPSSVFIPVSVVLIPHPRSDLAQTPDLALHGFILLLMQRKAQLVIPGFASASPPSLFNGIPNITCLNLAHLFWPGLAQIFLFARDKYLCWFFPPGAALPNFQRELIHVPIFQCLFLGLGLKSLWAGSACSPRHLLHHPLESPQELPKGWWGEALEQKKVGERR